MENSIIEEILFNDEDLCTKIRKGSEYERYVGIAADITEKLMKSMTEEQKVDLQKLIDVDCEMELEHSTDFFKEGFKRGVRLAVECLVK